MTLEKTFFPARIRVSAVQMVLPGKEQDSFHYLQRFCLCLLCCFVRRVLHKMRVILFWIGILGSTLWNGTLKMIVPARYLIEMEGKRNYQKLIVLLLVRTVRLRILCVIFMLLFMRFRVLNGR